MRSKPLILGALLFAAFLVNLDTTLVNVALPALVRELHATTTQLQWVIDAYNLVFAALLLTFGALSDRFGRKGMLLAGPDVAGLVLSAATMGLLVFSIIEAPTYGWTAARTLAGFAAAVVLLTAFIARERTAAHPMLDVRIFRDLRFSAASGAVTVSFFTLFGFIFLMTQYFQFVRGYGPLATGVRLLPVALAVGVGSVAGTQLAVRAGTKLIVTTGLVAMAAFYGWVPATTSATLSYCVIAAQRVVYGLRMGLTSAPATQSIMGANSAASAGVGSGPKGPN